MKLNSLLTLIALFVVGASPSSGVVFAQATELESLEAMVSDPAQLKKHLATGGSPNLVVSNNIPLLIAACYEGNLECIELLIDAGADLNSNSKNRNPPIMTAFVQTPDDQFKLLLEKGADPNVVSEMSGDTVLHLLATGDYVSRIFGKKSDSPRDLSAFEQKTIANYAKKEEALLVLLAKAGADFELENREGLTPLEVAQRLKLRRLEISIEKISNWQKAQKIKVPDKARGAKKTKGFEALNETDTTKNRVKQTRKRGQEQ